jgi:DNA-binding transcriptional MerR regulator
VTVAVTTAGRREYRVDELAREAGTSVRNVRVYQDRGLLDPPRRQGRVGYYCQAHLDRLRLIGRLLERGYTFATIAELLAAWRSGAGLSRVLGVTDAIGGPWSDETPEHVTPAELRSRFGVDDAAGFVTRAVRTIVRGRRAALIR